MTSRAPALPWLRPLDRLRHTLLAWSAPWLRPLIADRPARVAASGVVLIGLSFAATLIAPLWLLALGPIVYGVPHVVGDVRYLALRPGLLRAPGARQGATLRWELLPALLLLGVTGVTAEPLMGLAAVGATVLAAHGTLPRKSAVVALLAAIGALLAQLPWHGMLLIAHLHNLMAIALWWSWRRRSTRGYSHWPLLAFGLAGLALLSGWSPALLNWGPARLTLGYHAEVLAPGLSMVWATRLVLLFAFAQSVHYSVWIRLVPEDDRPQPTTRSFSASWRALEADLSRPLLWLIVLAWAGFALWAVFDLSAARSGYLNAALFHGYLEFMVGGLALVEGRRVLGGPRGPDRPGSGRSAPAGLSGGGAAVPGEPSRPSARDPS